MDKDAPCALFHQNQKFQTAVRECQRKTRDAVNQAVQESSESYEVLMMQEIQSIQNRHNGRRKMQGEWRRSWDPKHGKLYVVTETTCYKNIKYFSKQEKERKRVLMKTRCIRSCTHTSLVIEASYLNEKYNKSTFPKVSKTCRQKESNHHCRHRHPATLGNRFHRLPLLYRTRDQLRIKVHQKRKEAEKFDLSLGRVEIQLVEGLFSPRSNVGINSSSINQRAEIDSATSMGELDHLGFGLLVRGLPQDI